MDYDRYDAFLHHIFKRTQGEAWFAPDEQGVSGGVALRVAPGDFRVFPYEEFSLEPFEAAVSGLNPEVAVKLRTAAVHAILADLGPEVTSIAVDDQSSIQVLDTMLDLVNAEKEQCAAFIRDERVLIVWTNHMDSIVSECKAFEERLIKLLYSTRPKNSRPVSEHGPYSREPSIGGAGSRNNSPTPSRRASMVNVVRGMTPIEAGPTSDNDEKGATDVEMEDHEPETTKMLETTRTWYGRKRTVEVDVEVQAPKPRPVILYAPIYNGLAAGLAIFFTGSGVNTLIQEWRLDDDWRRFLLAITIPFLYCISLFFALQIVVFLAFAIGPIAVHHSNSKYYSAIRPPPNKVVDSNLPLITIQLPVYKESLEAVIEPSVMSIKKAMQTYARQGGRSSIFINDDGLRLLPIKERDERIAFYATHDIGWVARPGHNGAPGGFKRQGRFKKASNMNYALAVSLKMEMHIEELVAAGGKRSISDTSSFHSFGRQYQQIQGDNEIPEEREETLEEKALGMAIQDVYKASGDKYCPWAANGKACRVGSIVLIVDSDTIVPEDCFRDAAREMAEDPTVGVIQHYSEIMLVAGHFFENAMAFFNRRANRCMSMACANGEPSPFVGHNAFLRWKAVQDSSFIDPLDGLEKFWSETNVSEDFDMLLRLQLAGYITRWATYSNGGFQEGVSLTVEDEVNRWEKYAYGASELMLNPIIRWYKSPVAKTIHQFVWCGSPLHYKISLMAYLFSYFGIAASMALAIANYCLLGFEYDVSGFYRHSFEIVLATTVVFFGANNLFYAILEYRLGKKGLLAGLIENFKWVPFFFVFFGGLSVPISQALLCHLFSANISWGSTLKEVERSNFFKEVPKIFRRFWFPMLFSLIILAGVIVCSTEIVPLGYRVSMKQWGIVLPLFIFCGCHLIFPAVLNPYFLLFEY